MWPFKRRRSRCPEEACTRIAKTRLVGGHMCIGKLDEATDHVLPGVNDLCFCFKQNGRTNRWHFNKFDFRVLRRLLDRAENNLTGDDDAVHQAGTEGQPR